MIMGSLYSIMLYSFSIFIFMYGLDPLIFWLLMEINLLLFIFMSFSLNLFNKFYEKESLFLYFIIQSISSLAYLSTLYFHMDYNLYSDIFFLASLCAKIGIFPFYFWVLALSDSLNYLVFCILLSIQKIPMFFMFFNVSSYYMLMFLFFSLFFGSFMIFFSYNLKELLIFSSVSSSFFVFMLYSDSVLLFSVFFFIYIFSLLNLKMISEKIDSSSMDKIFLFIFLCGLPPLSLFFIKIYITSFLFSFNSFFLFLMFWVFSFVSLLGYTNYFYSSLFNSLFPYLKIKFLFTKMSFFICSLVNLTFFLVY